MNARVETAVLELQEQEPRKDMPLAAQKTAVAQAMPRAAVTPSDLLQIAMEAGDKDIERLERLMSMDIRYRELQEVDRQRDAEIAFEADFVGFTGEAIIIPKTKAVDRGRAGSFEQAEFDEVCRRLKPALARHGFGFRHKERFGSIDLEIEGVSVRCPWVWVSCILSHRGGHKDVLDLDGPADTQSANTPIQNAQSAASYLKRQSILAITGTATGGEDDEARMGKAGVREEVIANKQLDGLLFDLQQAGSDEAVCQIWDTGSKALQATGSEAAIEELGKAVAQRRTAFTYPADRFEKSMSSWVDVVTSGRKSEADLLVFIQTKHPLSVDQKDRISKAIAAAKK